MSRKRTFKILRVIVISTLSIWGIVILMLHFQPFPKELKYVNPAAHKTGDRLLSNCLVTKKDVKIYVGHKTIMDMYVIAYASTMSNAIYLSPRILDDKYFDVILAHEIGHLEKNTESQDEANLFAAKLVGKERVIRLYTDRIKRFRPMYARAVVLFNSEMSSRTVDYLKAIEVDSTCRQ